MTIPLADTASKVGFAVFSTRLLLLVTILPACSVFAHGCQPVCSKGMTSIITAQQALQLCKKQYNSATSSTTVKQVILCNKLCATSIIRH